MKFGAGIVMLILLTMTVSQGCHSRHFSNEEMVRLLSEIRDSENVFGNSYYPQAGIVHYDSLLRMPLDLRERLTYSSAKANLLLQAGREREAVTLLESLLPQVTEPDLRRKMRRIMAIGYMRIGERSNCLVNHTSESCLFPIQGTGVHVNKTGSYKAIELYEGLLQEDSTDLESRWLLNIAYMTVGGYPDKVPAAWLLKEPDEDSAEKVKPFVEIAGGTGLDNNTVAGGSLIEDMDNDGNLDVLTTCWALDEGMHYHHNNGDGTFTNVSAVSGLKDFTGGLNMMQTDYNNDGLKDIFILRGAWKGKFGQEPVSLLRNNGDGTFTDVTKESGLLDLHPTQTAVWADFNGDGWLDVFIGEESAGSDIHPCQLYLNNHDGTFTECAHQPVVTLSISSKALQPAIITMTGSRTSSFPV